MLAVQPHMSNVITVGRYQEKKEVFSDKVFRCRLRFVYFQDKFQKELRLKLACCMKQSRSQPTVPIVACGKAGHVIYYMFDILARRHFK